MENSYTINIFIVFKKCTYDRLLFDLEDLIQLIHLVQFRLARKFYSARQPAKFDIQKKRKH
jgi:arginine/lysine/ornithine decarboxylase